MASRISQMRNEIPPYPQTPQAQQQQQLNESIQNVKALMQQMQSMSNREAAIMNLLQSNPQLQSIIPLLKNGNNLEGIAKSMAQSSGADINQIIAGLLGK